MKLLLALSGINLLALPSAFAQSWIEYGDRGDLAYSSSRRNAAAGDYGSAFSGYKTSVSVEAFYAAATEDAVSSLGLDGADLGGVSARFSAEKHRSHHRFRRGDRSRVLRNFQPRLRLGRLDVFRKQCI
ncbi:MAG TPA: hypothetical protein IAC75_00035 [Candidatus Spyradosoma merdigallinarum]|uniref:Uncharacterized protein n=1 Tax=Candidatus Spyradosoma merdigallinarum TaxID=2840950 RepID=A0A9D1NJ63_9BACT|nr:hypothetical protein [Candidatus Spyradosoma merdigallinarum]